MKLFAYRPFNQDGSTNAWRTGIELGHIKNLPDNQADLELVLQYNDMRGQAQTPTYWGINSPLELSVVLWNNEFAASASTKVAGFRAWDPDNLEAGIMTFATAEDLLKYTSGGKTLFSPRVYPLRKDL